jgi:DNA-binding NarL/FixJ family response regulator
MRRAPTPTGKRISSSVSAGMGSQRLLPGTRRAIVLSDSPVMRAGVRALLPERSVQVVAELSGWPGLDERVRATSAQLVVAAPADGGDERLFRALDALPPGCGAIVLLAVPGFRIQAEAVARRFDVVCLPLNVDRDELHACIRGVLMRDEQGEVTVEELCTGVNGTLTAREHEVLKELAIGKTNREIAESLWLSQDTVKSHLRRVYHKLGVSTRAEAVALYVGQLGSA